MTTTMVQVTPESSVEELKICLGYLVDQAKAEARRGYSGIRGQRYAALHANIDLILTELLARA